MRLLNVNSLQLEEFDDDNDRPKYAILSHRWEAEEVTFRDLQDDTGNTKKGFHKLRMACKTASWDAISHIWIDTCCIDKSSSAELSEAINSMFRWYAEADRCYAYLFDVSSPDPGNDVSFSHSVWFTRSWTLQELIAPQNVIFHDRDWKAFGTKDTLQRQLGVITGIHVHALSNQPLSTFTVAQRMMWASKRKATRREDVAYSLMGLFDVNMPMLYGEGDKAFLRLQEEIIKRTTDRTILLWEHRSSGTDPQTVHRILAKSPEEFEQYHKSVQTVRAVAVIPGQNFVEPFTLTNAGLDIQLKLQFYALDTYLAWITVGSRSYTLPLRLVHAEGNRKFLVRMVKSPDRLQPENAWGPPQVHQITLCNLSFTVEESLDGYVMNDLFPPRFSHPHLDTANVKMNGSYDKSRGFWVRQTKWLTKHHATNYRFMWVCYIEMQTKESNQNTLRVFVRLGFDFWSNPIVLFWPLLLPKDVSIDGPDFNMDKELERNEAELRQITIENSSAKRNHRVSHELVSSSNRNPISCLLSSEWDLSIEVKRSSDEKGHPWTVKLGHATKYAVPPTNTTLYADGSSNRNTI